MKVEEIEIDETIGHMKDVLTNKQKASGLIIYALHQIQETHNFLPEDELKRLALKLNVPLSEVYSSATFYKQFHFTPRGKNIVCVCLGTACHVRGAGKILESFEKSFGIKVGETTEDMSVTLETVGCVGCCSLAPVVTVNEEITGEVTPEKFNALATEIRDKQ